LENAVSDNKGQRPPAPAEKPPTLTAVYIHCSLLPLAAFSTILHKFEQTVPVTAFCLGILAAAGAGAALWEVKLLPYQEIVAPLLCFSVFALTIAGYCWFAPEKWKKDDNWHG
jgi:ABC-type multidrug transport system permease subunit